MIFEAGYSEEILEINLMILEDIINQLNKIDVSLLNVQMKGRSVAINKICVRINANGKK